SGEKPKETAGAGEKPKVGTVFRSAEKAVGAAVYYSRGKLSPSGPWLYMNADGTAEVLRVYRIDEPDGKGGEKQFRPVYQDAAGWHLGDPMKSGLPLYHLDELADAQTVALLEGEKCCDLARGLGIVATTSSHGASAPQKTDFGPLAGKVVVIIPDRG